MCYPRKVNGNTTEIAYLNSVTIFITIFFQFFRSIPLDVGEPFPLYTIPASGFLIVVRCSIWYYLHNLKLY